MKRLLLLAFVAAATAAPTCGSSSGSSSSGGSSSSPPTLATNFQSIVVNAGPANNYFNCAFTSVMICVPGSSSCQTIDGILVDTGSTGLRVLGSAVTLALPQQTDASGAPIAECFSFLDGFTWGPVQSADIRMGGEQASNAAVQIIGTTPAVPAACASSGTAENTLDTLGANGVLGIGLFR